MKNPRLAQSMSAICEREHFVHFYQKDGLLIDNLKSFIGGGIVAGDASVLIASPKHRLALETALKQAGVDLDAAMADSKYIALDAAETLAEFMVDGMPNRVSFEQVIGEQLSKVAGKGKTIRAFGEMVVLLMEQQNEAGAILLEQLWNEISGKYSLTLFCAYPSSHFQLEPDAPMRNQIKQMHSSTLIEPSPI